MQSKKKWLIAIILLAAICGAAFYFLYFIRTPAYALNEARVALKEHDSTKFSRYVDVSSVMDNAFEDIIKAESKINNDNIFSNPFALGILHMLKPSVVDLMTKEALDRVAGKAEDPNKQAADPVPDAMKRNMERHIHVGKLTVKDLQLTKHSGDTATATLVVHDSDVDKDLVAELLLQHNEAGDWQIKKVSNLEDFIVHLDAAKRAKQAAANKPIIERLNKALQTTSERLTLNKDAQGKSGMAAEATLTATIMAKNMTQVAINRMYYDVTILNDKGEHLYSYPEHYQGSIPPGKAVELTTTKKLNPLLPDDKKLMELDVTKETVKIQVTYIAFDDGDVLSPNTFVE